MDSQILLFIHVFGDRMRGWAWSCITVGSKSTAMLDVILLTVSNEKVITDPIKIHVIKLINSNQHNFGLSKFSLGEGSVLLLTFLVTHIQDNNKRQTESVPLMFKLSVGGGHTPPLEYLPASRCSLGNPL